MPVEPDRSLWRSWFATVTVAEFLGFSAPAVVGALTAGHSAIVVLPALVGAGVVEGAALGAAQAFVLRRALPAVRTLRFTAATALAAGTAYALAMVPVALGEIEPPAPWPLIGVVLALCGSLLLASIGTAQWLVLRRELPGSASWVGTTAGAWLVGLGVFLAVATPLWEPGQALWLTIAIGLLGGLAMAATVAGLTGWALLRLLRRASTAVQR